MIALVEDNLTKIEKICRRYGVARLDLFGSATGEAFDPEGSDLLRGLLRAARPVLTFPTVLRP